MSAGVRDYQLSVEPHEAYTGFYGPVVFEDRGRINTHSASRPCELGDACGDTLKASAYHLMIVGSEGIHGPSRFTGRPGYGIIVVESA